MNSQQHRKVATFMDLFDCMVRETIGLPSDYPYCFNRSDYSEEERAAIVSYLKGQLAKEQSCIEYAEHPKEAERLLALYNLVITAFDGQPCKIFARPRPRI